MFKSVKPASYLKTSRLRISLLGISILLPLLLTACLSTNVSINLQEDGSGEVGFSISFDRATLSKYPELLDSIKLEDLEAGDWQIVYIDNLLEAGRTISATKKIFNESQIQIVLDEISPGAFDTNVRRTNAGTPEEAGDADEAGNPDEAGDDEAGNPGNPDEGTKISINGSLDIPRFRSNLLAGSNIDLTELPPEASQIQISTQLGTPEDFTTKNWQVSLTSDKTLNFSHTHAIGGISKNANRLWLWVSITAFSLLGLTLMISFLGWANQKRQKTGSALKPSAKLKK